MSDLIENMALLNVMVPAVAGQIAPVATEAGQAIAAAKALVEDAEEKRTDAKALLESVTNALAALRDGATEDRGRLEQALATAKDVLEAAVAAFEEGEESVRRAANGAGGALDHLQQALVRTAERASAAQQNLSDRASAVAVGFASASSDIERAVATAAGTAGKIESAITSGRGTIRSAAAELLAEVAPVPDAVQSLLGDCTTRMESELKAMKGDVGGALADLESRSDAAVQALREALEEQQQPLDGAVTDAQNALGSLCETAVTPIEDLAESRGDAASGTESLEPQMTALEAGVERLRTAAATAGIEWPTVSI